MFSFLAFEASLIPIHLVIKVLSGVNIRTYMRKGVLPLQSFADDLQKAANLQNPSLKNGKTAYTNDDIRVDFGENNDETSEWTHLNLQKNKACKLEGIKAFKTHEKLISFAVKKGSTITPEEAKKAFEPAL
jgi:hypothetical protein